MATAWYGSCSAMGQAASNRVWAAGRRAVRIQYTCISIAVTSIHAYCCYAIKFNLAVLFTRCLWPFAGWRHWRRKASNRDKRNKTQYRRVTSIPPVVTAPSQHRLCFHVITAHAHHSWRGTSGLSVAISRYRYSGSDGRTFEWYLGIAGIVKKLRS